MTNLIQSNAVSEYRPSGQSAGHPFSRKSTPATTLFRGLCCLWLVLSGILTPSPGGLFAEEDFSKIVEDDFETLRERILTCSKLPGGAVVAPLVESPTPLWVERCFIGSNDVYSGEGFRYAVIRLTIGNRTERDLVIRRDEITLKTDTATFSIGPGRSRRFQNSPLEIDWTPEQHPRPQTLLETPKTITVHPGKATTIWTTFFGFESLPAIPNLTLSVRPDGQEPLVLNLNEQQGARLGLSQFQLGPEQCVTAFQIAGHLNRINAALLADRITAAQAQGVHRFLFEWNPPARASDDVLFSWLLTTSLSVREENPLLLQLPPIPELKQVAVCQVPEENREALEWDDHSEFVYSTSQEGCQALLKDVFERVSVDVVLREIRSGHPWSQAAALRVAGQRLGKNALPTLMELTQQNSPEIRRAAILALGNQPSADAFLKARLLESPPDEAALALESLAAFATEERRAYVSQIVKNPQLQIPRPRVIDILAKNYHPAWDSFLIDSTQHTDPDVRRSALTALRQLGHMTLDQICMSMLADPDEDVRESAFEALRISPDSSAREAALRFVMQQLTDQQVIPESGLELIEEMRESSAAPLLITLLAHPELPRSRYIDVIGNIGTSEDCQRVIAMIDQFDHDEVYSAMNLIPQLPIALQLRTAHELAASKNPAILRGVVHQLGRLTTPDAVALLGELWRTSDESLQTEIADALGLIGTQSAITELRKLRTQACEKDQITQMLLIDNAFREWRHRLPGWSFVESGNGYVRGNELREAVKAYSVAITINPELSEAYSMRGNTHLRLNQVDPAGEDFRKALELDPFDSQAVTGHAIVQAIEGEWEQAIQFVKDRRTHFPNDRFFPYNVACVIGRAIESIRKEGESSEHHQRIPQLQIEAIEQLKIAIALGFSEFSWMKIDPDLAALRDLPEFKLLLSAE